MKLLDFDFKNKTVEDVRAKLDEVGLTSDMVIKFTDGTLVQIGATKEGYLVCIKE